MALLCRFINYGGAQVTTFAQSSHTTNIPQLFELWSGCELVVWLHHLLPTIRVSNSNHCDRKSLVFCALCGWDLC